MLCSTGAKVIELRSREPVDHDAEQVRARLEVALLRGSRLLSIERLEAMVQRMELEPRKGEPAKTQP